MNRVVKHILFSLPPERSHRVAMEGMRWAHKLGLSRILARDTGRLLTPAMSREVMGLKFPHPVGLAAGLDKSAEYTDPLHGLGFAFLEVGTLTPRPQPGNPAPRLFRLPEQQALINRMGFNNHGIQHAVAHLKRRRSSGVLGVNIGKNFDTPIEQAADDYLTALRACYDTADYVAVNISSPNTPELRSLQHGAALKNLLAALKQEQERLTAEKGRYVPIAVKIAPDMTGAEIRAISQSIHDSGMDGIIAVNATLNRFGAKASPLAAEQGGLSGAPLTGKAVWVIQLIRDQLGDKTPIIGVGGIMSPTDALKRLEAGADLLQIYSGFIYHGPKLIRDILLALKKAG